MALAGVWLLSELRWMRINTPGGRFTNARQYLSHGRLPSHVVKAHRNGKTYFVAYGPLDTWLAIPSGPAVYVFDEKGQMVEWSRDIGNDAKFQSEWSQEQETSSTNELSRLGQHI